MKKRILSMICALALCLGLLPTTVFAADGDKAIMLGTNGISGYDDSTNSYDYIYFGNWEAPDEYTTTGPIKWRVLDDQTNTEGTGLFLLSDGLFGQGNKYGGGVRFRQDRTSNAWQGSDAQKWCRDFYGSSFSTGEQGAVLATTKTDAAYKATSVKPPIDFLGSELEGDTVFFLSAEEVENKAYGFIDNAARRAYFGNTGNWGAWWLRSPDKLTSTVAGTITRSPTSSAGSLSGNFVNNDSYTARPAFNLNLDDVLFTSAAVGGKSASGMESGLTAVDAYDGSEWKLTLLDDSRVFDVTETDISGDPGDTITLHYTGATTGDNEYISVILAAESSVQYYGRIAKATTEEGEISLTIPDTLAEGTYTLNVFNEQCNGDYKTDYASAFETFTLTVDITAPTLSAGSATRDSETTATVKFTSNEAGSYYYEVVNSGENQPTIDTAGTGTTCDTTEQTISLTNLSDTSAKDIYIVVKDAVENVSQTLQIVIPEFIPTYTISASPAALNFGSKTVDYTEAPDGQTVTITNTGNQTVTVTLPTSTNYTITAGTGFANGTATLAPNGTATFAVQPKTGLAVGSYSETLTISSNHNTSAEVSLAFTVDPKSLDGAQVQVSGSYIYDGNAKEPSGENVTVTLHGEPLTENTDYTLSYEDNTDAGEATVKVSGTGNYSGTVTGTFQIAKATPTVSDVAVSSPATIYASTDISAITLTYTGTEGTVALDAGQTLTVGENSYRWTFTPTDSNNYETATGTITLTVVEDTLDKIEVSTAPTKTEYTYGDSLDLSGMVVTATYKSGATKNVTEEATVSPDILDTSVTELTITYGSQTTTQAITVNPKTVSSPIIELSGTSFEYTGSEIKPTVTVKDGKTVIHESEYTVEYSNNTNVGTATVTIKNVEGGNYTVGGSTTFEITKAKAVVTTAPTANTLTYTGNPQALVTAGEAEGGTLVYSLEKGGNYDVVIPTGTNAGSYTVFYYVKGDANHSDTDPVQVEVTIKKADPDVTVPDNLTATYGNTLNDVTLPDDWSWNDPDTTSVGNVGSNTFSATYTPSDTTNYNTVTKNLAVTVSAKGITGAEITLGDVLTYTGQQQTQQIASVTMDGLDVTYTVTGNAGTDAGAYTLTVTGTGNYTGTATKEWTIAKANYNGTTDVSGTVLANWPDKVTLPDIPAGASYGAASYDGSDGAVKDLSIEGGVLSYTGGESITVDQAYKITVPVDGGKNYEDYTITVTLTGSDKQTLTITGVTAQGGTYNGQPQQGYTGTPSAEGYGGGFTVTYNTADGEAPTNAGAYIVTIAIPEDNAQYVGSADLQFTIAPKALTVSAPSPSVYVGDSAPELALTYTGLVAGESVTPSEDPVFTITKADGTVIALEDAVKTAGTYTITWSNANDTTFTGADNYDITLKNTGTLTVTVRSSGGGSSSNITTETTKNPDGSTTITVTNKVTGTVTETTTWPDGSKEVIETKKDGTVTTTTTDTTGNKTQVVENTDGTKETTITNKDGSSSATTVDETGKTQAEVKLPAAVVEDAQGEVVTLPMPEVPVTTDRETAPTVTVDLPSGTTAKVEIPVADVTPGTVAVIVKADGTEEVIKTSLTTENGVAVTLSDGDTVKIVDNSKTFDDVADNYWGAEAVDFAVSRELFAGTSATTFAPDTAMTRAMIVTVLARFEGVDTTTGSTWYEAGQQWAMENGVSDGTNMDASLTREQLATMLYRYAQSKGYDTTQGGMAIREYADFEQISDYAVEAMTWAVNTGLISGTSTTTLSPQGLATRAQVATILMRFIEGMA